MAIKLKTRRLNGLLIRDIIIIHFGCDGRNSFGFWFCNITKNEIIKPFHCEVFFLYEILEFSRLNIQIYSSFFVTIASALQIQGKIIPNALIDGKKTNQISLLPTAYSMLL